jgi:hypothetical protein
LVVGKANKVLQGFDDKREREQHKTRAKSKESKGGTQTRRTCQKMKSWQNGEVKNIEKKEREFKNPRNCRRSSTLWIK